MEESKINRKHTEREPKKISIVLSERPQIDV